MDITSISGASAYQQGQVATNVSTTVAAKVLESQRAEGADALKLLQSAIPQTSGSTSSVDVQA